MSASAPSDGPRLPPPPERPDCCAGGCAVCVLDEYVRELQDWQDTCARLEAEWAATRTDTQPSSRRHP